MSEALSSRTYNSKRLNNTTPTRGPKANLFKATYLQHLRKSVSKSPLRQNKTPNKIAIKRPKVLPPLTKSKFIDLDIQAKYEEIKAFFKNT